MGGSGGAWCEGDEEMVARWWWGSGDDDGGDNDGGVVMMVMSTVGGWWFSWSNSRGVAAVVAVGGGEPRVRASGYGDRVLTQFRELHYLLDKVVSVGTAPGPNSSDHNVNTITNGDGMPRMRTFRETIFPE
ncbi:hypothetical protein Tco_0600687 [Tanacetum coccineum]